MGELFQEICALLPPNVPLRPIVVPKSSPGPLHGPKLAGSCLSVVNIQCVLLGCMRVRKVRAQQLKPNVVSAGAPHGEFDCMLTFRKVASDNI